VLKRPLAPILILGMTAGVLVAVLWMTRPTGSPGPYGQGEPTSATVQVRGTTFHVDVVASPEALAIGLSHTASLPADRGMLFLFDKPDYYQFWMKGMTFPLDIIFVRNSTIVPIARNVPVPSGDGELPRYAPDEPIDKVLEINAGLSDQYGIQSGDAVEIIFPTSPQ
jgi:uncharacterized membrane protein (UPF0127 family)